MKNFSFDDFMWMQHCLNLAQQAYEIGEVPVGSIIVLNEQIIGRGFNRREMTGDPTAHAEIIALRQASKAVGNWRLIGATQYVTLEPCAMCAGALVNSRIERLVYGCKDPKAGAVDSLYELLTDRRLNHRLNVSSGLRAHECGEYLRSFFEARRRPRV